MSAPDFDLAAHYAAALDELDQIGAHYFAGEQLAQSVQVLAAGQALADAPGVPSLPLVKLLCTYGLSLTWQASLATGAYEPALAIWQQALERVRGLDQPLLRAAVLDGLGFTIYHQTLGSGSSDFSAAHGYFQQAFDLRAAQADPQGLCVSRFHLALIAERERRFEEAEAGFRAVYQLAQAGGFDAERGEAARHLGFAHLRAGQLDLALHSFREALAQVEKGGNLLFLPFAHLSVGEVLQEQQDYAAAQKHYEAALAGAEAAQVRRAAAQSLYSLGELAEAQDNAPQAREHFEAALRIAHEIGFTLGQRLLTEKLASLRPSETMP